MFVGKQDNLGTPELGRWTLDKVNSTHPNVIYYEELDDHDHFTSSVGNDMSFMDDVIKLLDQVN